MLIEVIEVIEMIWESGGQEEMAELSFCLNTLWGITCSTWGQIVTLARWKMVSVTYAKRSTERSKAVFSLLLRQVQKVQKVVEAKLKIRYGWRAKITIYPDTDSDTLIRATFMVICRLEYRTCDQVSSCWVFDLLRKAHHLSLRLT